MRGILTTESQRHRKIGELKDPRTSPIIAAAIEVHRLLGPGLLESAYEQCLCHELHLRGLSFERQVDLPVLFKGLRLDCGYKMDLVVNDAVVLELKCVEKIARVHEARDPTHDRVTASRGRGSKRPLDDTASARLGDFERQRRTGVRFGQDFQELFAHGGRRKGRAPGSSQARRARTAER